MGLHTFIGQYQNIFDLHQIRASVFSPTKKIKASVLKLKYTRLTLTA